MALHRRGGVYHYHFWVDGKRYRGSTKKRNEAAARRVESLLLAQAQEKGEVLLRRRSPVLRDFKTRFLNGSKAMPSSSKKPKTITRTAGDCSKGRKWRRCGSVRSR